MDKKGAPSHTWRQKTQRFQVQNKLTWEIASFWRSPCKNMCWPPMRQSILGKMTLGSFFSITLLFLELVWFGFLSYDWVLVWCYGFLSYVTGSCLMIRVLVLCNVFLSYDMGSCLMIWVLVLWLGFCRMVGFLSYGWVLVLWYEFLSYGMGSCLMICLMSSISLNV